MEIERLRDGGGKRCILVPFSVVLEKGDGEIC